MKSLTQIRVLGIIMLGLISVGVWFLVLSPRAAEPEALQNTEAEAVSQKLNLDRQIEILERRAVYLEDAIGVADQLGVRFPWQPDVPSLIEQVEIASREAGMDPSQVTSIIPSKPTTGGISPALAGEAAAAVGGGAAPAEGEEGAEGGGAVPALAVMDVVIEANGSYKQVTDFLIALRSGDRVIVIDSINLALSADPARMDPNADPATIPSEKQYRVQVAAHTVLLPQGMQVPEAPSVRDETVQNGQSTETGEEEDSSSTPTPSESVAPSTAATEPAEPTATAAE